MKFVFPEQQVTNVTRIDVSDKEKNIKKKGELRNEIKGARNKFTKN
jgi:hypothetical protein